MKRNANEREVRRGRPSGGGGAAKVLSADEVARVLKCLTDTRTEARDRAMFLHHPEARGARVAGDDAALYRGDAGSGAGGCEGDSALRRPRPGAHPGCTESDGTDDPGGYPGAGRRVESRWVSGGAGVDRGE